MERNEPLSPPKPKNIHDGHRKRTKQKFLENGGDGLHDHQLLELILFYAHPQGDVNPLAHQLEGRFGTLRAVLEASPEELVQVVGVSYHTAALLKLFPAVMRRLHEQEIKPGTPVTSIEEAAEVLRHCFVGLTAETLYLLTTDAKGKLLACDRISQGAIDAVLLDQRRIVEKIIQRRASQAYLAHCHPTGLALASREDIWATRRLRQTLELLNVRLNDHLIFADGDYVSMVQSGDLEAYD
ncbi:MAG: DNA repair protein RadC [Oscillospiraceae bacterium]|nr:DNA repair protein RadC [Oscillospiraceae bacterium]